MASTGDALGHRFESQPNALNFLRLCLALEVIVWHSYALRGSTWLPGWVTRPLGDIAVDSFFAISGFLITRAWIRRPSAGRFLLARARRVLPGLWVCLLVTAFALAPLVAWWTGQAAPPLSSQWHYVLRNALTRYAEPGIAGGPAGVPVAGAWNGSLWSLGFEVNCYLLVLAAGIVGVLRKRALVVGATVAAWGLLVAGSATVPPLSLRTLLMFGCGATLYLFADLVPSSRRLAVGCGLVLAASLALPDYRVLAAFPLAYLCIFGGLELGRRPELVLRHDFSYGTYIYAFPVQQALLACGVTLGWAGFAGLSSALTLPVAAASWFLVERPAQRLGSMSSRPATARPGVPATADSALVP
jgi:peptidoglycan/LPS O-acetylase OafA/YrhL